MNDYTEIQCPKCKEFIEITDKEKQAFVESGAKRIICADCRYEFKPWEILSDSEMKKYTDMIRNKAAKEERHKIAKEKPADNTISRKAGEIVAATILLCLGLCVIAATAKFISWLF